MARELCTDSPTCIICRSLLPAPSAPTMRSYEAVTVLALGAALSLSEEDTLPCPRDSWGSVVLENVASLNHKGKRVILMIHA